MLKINQYIVVESIEQAYELNQKKTNVILGGTGWLKMTNANIQTAIDLSQLGFDKIEENKDEISIGSMVTLRDLETNLSLDTYGQGSIKKALHHIVGVQFRNCATVGGSIFSRFGFSDVLTNLMCFDSYVELYKQGLVSLAEYAKMPRDNDIIIRIIIKKTPIKIAYQCFRHQSTDFPVLTCGTSIINNNLRIIIGARPSKAMIIVEEPYIKEELNHNNIEDFAERITKNIPFQSNMRGSAEYRSQLAKVLVKRAMMQMTNNLK